VLPLVTSAVAGTNFRIATLDLAGDAAALAPGAALEGVLSLRLRGGFEIGDIVLEDRID
jgi:hypothetical protein